MKEKILALTSHDGFFKCYDLEKGHLLICLKSDFGAYNCFEFSPDNSLVALGGQDDSITLLDLQSGHNMRIEGYHKTFITSVLWMPEYMMPESHKQRRTHSLVVGSMDSCLSFWEVS